MPPAPRSASVPARGWCSALLTLLLCVGGASAAAARPATSLRQLPAGRRLPKLDEASAKAVPLIRVPLADILASVKAGCRESATEIKSKGKTAGVGLEWCRLETRQGREVLASYYFFWFGKPLRLTSALRYSLEAPGPIEELVFEDTTTTRHETKTLRIGLQRTADGWTQSDTKKVGFIEQGSDSTLKTVEQTLENSEDAFWVLLRTGKLKVGETYRYAWYDPSEKVQTSVAMQVQAFQDAKTPADRRYRVAQLVLHGNRSTTLLLDGLARTVESQSGTLSRVILSEEQAKVNFARARPQLEPKEGGGAATGVGSGPARVPTKRELEALSRDLARWGVTGMTPAKLAGLKELSLAGSKIRDGQLGQLAVLGTLEELDLTDTKIDGSGLVGLAPLVKLRKLTLPPGVEAARVEAFKKVRPGCTVVAPPGTERKNDDPVSEVLDWVTKNVEEVIIAVVVIVIIFGSSITALFKRRKSKTKAKAKVKPKLKVKVPPKAQAKPGKGGKGDAVSLAAVMKAKSKADPHDGGKGKDRPGASGPQAGGSVFPHPPATAVVPVAVMAATAAPPAPAPALGTALPVLLGELAQCAGQPAESVMPWFDGRWVGQPVWGEGTVSYATQVFGLDPEFGVEGGVKVTLDLDPVVAGQYPPKVSLHLPVPPPPEQVSWGLRVRFAGVVHGFDPLNLQLRIGQGTLSS